jgi:hypothetical protein
MYDDDLRTLDYRRKKRTFSSRHPVLARLAGLVVGMFLFVPVLWLIAGDDGDTVRTQALPGAALGGDGLLSGDSTSVAVDSTDSAAASTDSVAPSDVQGTLPPTVPDATPTDPTTGAQTASAASTPSSIKVVRAPSTTSAPPTRAATTPTAVVKVKAPATTTTTAKPAPKPATTTTTKPKPVTTTTTTRPPVNYTQAQVVAIIRSVWPTDLQDKALAIAWRESNYQPRARNSCCYGLFQINAAANVGSLRALGVTANDLFDPLVNARVAYFMYQRSGWGPWGG